VLIDIADSFDGWKKDDFIIVVACQEALLVGILTREDIIRNASWGALHLSRTSPPRRRRQRRNQPGLGQ